MCFRILITVLFSCSSLFLIFLEYKKDREKGVFLAVGQGHSFLLRLEDGTDFLFDTGAYANIAHPLSKEIPFWDRTIEHVYISHPDRDHME